jgi:hypothetical protein
MGVFAEPPGADVQPAIVFMTATKKASNILAAHGTHSMFYLDNNTRVLKSEPVRQAGSRSVLDDVGDRAQGVGVDPPPGLERPALSVPRGLRPGSALAAGHRQARRRAPDSKRAQRARDRAVARADGWPARAARAAAVRDPDPISLPLRSRNFRLLGNRRC